MLWLIHDHPIYKRTRFGLKTHSQPHLFIVSSGLIISLIIGGCSAPQSQSEVVQTKAPVQESHHSGSLADYKLIQPEATEAPVSIETKAAAPTPTIIMPTATPAPTLTTEEWQNAPVIPSSISQRTREIYQRGLEMGNDPRHFSKVGDCEGTTTYFLGSFDLGKKYYNLGPYEDLQNVIDYYAGSYSRNSVAVRRGFNASSVLSVMWSDPKLCEPQETPLACEYRLYKPSVSLIMLGTNDFSHKETFEDRMRQIIEFTIDKGIVPILATKADNIENDGSINRIIVQLSREYDIPLWNFWRALEDLPNRGMQIKDGVHLAYADNYFNDSKLLLYGWPVRNLTALQTLDAVLDGLMNSGVQVASETQHN